MTNLRIGHGYDVHRLVPGRPLILGGVHVDYDRGLDGHSDADVLVHAVMDALLGAAGLADIGTLFPDSDAALLNVSSILLLERVAQKLAESRVQVVNIDATLIAQAPKIAPYRAQMRRNIARALGIDPEQVGVKATTEEHLGFTGDGFRHGGARGCACGEKLKTAKTVSGDMRGISLLFCCGEGC
ncbi:MAG: 2-C-methyl-D-erythritol 2,4-cyclodiphosphate synthase [Oscillospiraceae bacterium]